MRDKADHSPAQARDIISELQGAVTDLFRRQPEVAAAHLLKELGRRHLCGKSPLSAGRMVMAAAKVGGVKLCNPNIAVALQSAGQGGLWLK